jgi:hypothetical protein
MERFGLIKLNKILWKADFAAFAARSVPVTGRAYQRLPLGPAPIEMAPLLAEMEQDGLIRFEFIHFGVAPDGQEIIEKRPIALVEPNLRWFSPDDMSFVDEAIDYYWGMTGMETSDDSHGVAWRSRNNFDPMPYESAFLSEEKIHHDQLTRILELARERGWRSH